MTLSESIFEDVALEWFGELGYAVLHSRVNAHVEPAAERGSFGEVVIVTRLCEAMWTLVPVSVQSRMLATLSDTLLPELLSGETSFTVTH